MGAPEGLRDAVRRLEACREVERQVALLGRLGALLLTDICLELAPDVQLLPVWVEAYYYRPGRFEDPAVHRSPGQAGRFGQLYLHKKGYGGADICLSLGEYYLSYLLKYSMVNGQLLSQLGLRYLLRELMLKDPSLPERQVVAPVPEHLRDHKPVYLSPRKGLNTVYLRWELLAAVKGVGELPFRYERGWGAKKLLAQAPILPEAGTELQEGSLFYP